jgi:hypothetical protein
MYANLIAAFGKHLRMQYRRQQPVFVVFKFDQL